MCPRFWYPPILTYHRISPKASADTPTLEPSQFERQMEILATHWRPIPLDQLVESLEEKLPLPKRSVVVTFDDGTEDFFAHAFPILSRARVPATVFLIVGNIDGAGFLRRSEIQKMLQANISFGSHTLAHEYLPSLPLASAEETLSVSKQLLQEIGVPAKHLSYPAGGFNAQIAKIARMVGYRSACTTNRGYRRFPIDLWALRRISMHAKASSIPGMWLSCSGYSGLNRRLRSPQ